MASPPRAGPISELFTAIVCVSLRGSGEKVVMKHYRASGSMGVQGWVTRVLAKRGLGGRLVILRQLTPSELGS